MKGSLWDKREKRSEWRLGVLFPDRTKPSFQCLPTLPTPLSSATHKHKNPGSLCFGMMSRVLSLKYNRIIRQMIELSFKDSIIGLNISLSGLFLGAEKCHTSRKTYFFSSEVVSVWKQTSFLEP